MDLETSNPLGRPLGAECRPLGLVFFGREHSRSMRYTPWWAKLLSQLLGPRQPEHALRPVHAVVDYAVLILPEHAPFDLLTHETIPGSNPALAGSTVSHAGQIRLFRVGNRSFGKNASSAVIS